MHAEGLYVMFIIVIIIIVWLVLEWTLSVSTSDLHAEGSLMENTLAEMSWIASLANTGKLGGRKPDSSLESLLGRPK